MKRNINQYKVKAAPKEGEGNSENEEQENPKGESNKTLNETPKMPPKDGCPVRVFDSNVDGSVSLDGEEEEIKPMKDPDFRGSEESKGTFIKIA